VEHLELQFDSAKNKKKCHLKSTIMSNVELDQVYLNSKTRQALAIFPNPNPKKPNL